MTLVRTRAVSFMTLCVAGLVGSQVAAAQEPAPAPEVPVATPPPPSGPAETGVAVAPPPVSAPQPAQPGSTPAPAATPPAATAPGAPAPAGAFDWGGRQVEPLPPAPEPADPQRIRTDAWRGRYWLAPRLTITGPIGGDTPARPTLLTVGGGVDFGVRANNRFGVGMGLSGQIHTSVRTTSPGTIDKVIQNGGAFFWDALFLRVYFLKKRFQPLLEVGGGLARVTHPIEGKLYGAQLRAGAGFDAWVSGQVTLGFTTVYRLIALHLPQDGITPASWSVGHALQGVLQVGLHW